MAKEFNGQIASGTEKSALFTEAETLGVKTHRLKFLKRQINPVWDFLALFEIFFLIRRLKPDIVHLNSTKAGQLGSLIGKLAGSKVIFSARGFVFNEPRFFLVNWFYILMEKIASWFRDLIITVSESDRQSAIKYHLKNPGKIITVHNSIRPVNFLDRDTARQTLGINRNKLILGTIANFYHAKGLDILMRALATLASEELNRIQIVIIGGGPLEKQIKNLAVELHLDRHITYTGQVPDASKLLKAFDAFVLPSRKEGFPLVLLEAMQAGLPIIATNVGGNAEALGSAAGILVPSQDPVALAAAIKKLITNEDMRIDMSHKSLSQANRFPYDQHLSEISQVYNSLMTK